MAAALLIGAALPASALDVSDPFDPVYRDLDQWQERGYISELPHLKPYPLQLVRSLLQEVSHSAPDGAAQRARAYLGEIDRGVEFGFEGFVRGSINAGEAYSGILGTLLTSQTFLSESVSLTGGFGPSGIAEPGAEDAYVPGTRARDDYYVDVTADAGEMTVTPSFTGNGLAAVGSDSLWLQAGFTRHSFGSTWDGPVMSPYAPAAGHISFTWRTERVIYSNFLLALTATADDGTAITEEGRVRGYPNKYLAGHSFQFFPRPWLSLSLWETIVYGERFDPVYLIPGISRVYYSVYSGATDNMMIGLSAEARLPLDLSWNATLYMDDLHMVNLLLLDLNTRYKAAMQTELSWTPEAPQLESFERLAVDYSLVMPYTYTHRVQSIRGVQDDGGSTFAEDYNAVNYVNYAHQGRSMVSLAPNSDRLRLEAQFRPADALSLTLSSAFLRHANATEEPYEEAWYVGTGDGGINDNGYDLSGDDHRFDTVRFLTQDVIERRLQAGIGVSYELPVGRASLAVDAGYTFEYGWNRRGAFPATEAGDWENGQVPIESNDGAASYFDLGVAYRY